MKKITLALLSALALTTYQVSAQQIQFNGDVPGTCSIGTPTDGTLGLDTTTVTNDTLSSEVGSGAAGAVSITNNSAGGFTLVIAENSYTAPSGSTNLTTRNIPSISSGANIGATFSGTTSSPSRSTTLTNTGTDNITMNAKIVRSGSQALLPGNYTLIYDVACNAI